MYAINGNLYLDITTHCNNTQGLSSGEAITVDDDFGVANYCKLENFEPKRDKTNIMTYAASEDSDQPGCPHEETLGPSLPIEHTAKTDRLGRCPG